MAHESELGLANNLEAADAPPLVLRAPAASATRPGGQLLAPGELISLYQSIETGLPDLAARVVEFVSAYPAEGTTTVAWELAGVAAETLAKRTLFIDVTAAASPVGSALRSQVKAGLLDVAYDRVVLDDAVVGAGPPLLGYAVIGIEGGSNDGLLAHLDRIKVVIEALRKHFDLIVVNAPNALSNANSVGIGRLVDGVVLVLEAERTRAPVMQQIMQVLEASGATLLGVVLNKRKFHIPRWIYRWL